MAMWRVPTIPAGRLDQPAEPISERIMKPKGKNSPPKADEAKPKPTRSPFEAGPMYAIRFPTREARVRAIEIFINILLPTQVYTGGINVVYGVHVEALKRAGIPFEDLSEAPKKDGKKKVRKTTPLPPERP
jgi:hypothetical protein